MLKKPKQFEPKSQMVNAFDDLQNAMIEARAAIDRVGWLKDRLLSEFQAVSDAKEMLEIYTEAEAAKLLKIETTHLAEMRRRLDLPHTSFGNRARYTRPQLIAICSIMEINAQNKESAGRAA